MEYGSIRKVRHQAADGCLRAHLPRARRNRNAKGPSKGPRVPPAGRHATDGHEPRQVRKEAAISDAGCVVLRTGRRCSGGPFGGLWRGRPPIARSPHRISKHLIIPAKSLASLS
jgi:hypothetical protein